MLPSAAERIRSELPADALVLDVGGWAHPFARADWVLDLMPYETRGLYGRPDSDPERFTDATWVTRDICAREPWPFEDGQFAFCVCAHTLEDIRDPVWVCDEMARVARAGYIEVPSRVQEMTWGVQGDWTGWGHHHWLCDVEEASATIRFLFKHHIVNAERFRLPPGSSESGASEATVSQLWWQDELHAYEHFDFEPGALDRELETFRRAHARPAPRRGSRLLPWRDR
jgi:hypothetical protein